MGCKDYGKITGIWYIEPKYNYISKVAKAMEENNIKYLKMLIKKGKLSYEKIEN